MKQIMQGVFTWYRRERQTNRYGYYYVDNEPSGDGKEIKSFFQHLIDRDEILRLQGTRCKLTAVVLEARNSSHIGDMNLGLVPSTPEVGATFVLGVGLLDYLLEDDDDMVIGLKPTDGRKELWTDPRTLYQLHSQTIALYVEETDEADSAVPDLKTKYEPGTVISTGNGGFQEIGGDSHNRKVKPKVERLGDGCFILSHDHQKGEIVELG